LLFLFYCRPVSAYALFFRDTQAAIKGQNPNASFGEVSKNVASMWDVLAPEHKNVSIFLVLFLGYKLALYSKNGDLNEIYFQQQINQSNILPSF
jgi:hypothetical protein